VSAFALVAVLAGLAGTSSSAFAAGPKPDPPPIKRAPPPPPAPRPAPPPPPVYQAPPPPPAVYQAPPSGPTAAQILAAQRAAARAQAAKRAKAQRLKKQRLMEQRIKRQKRAARIAAEGRAERARQRAAASLLTRQTLATSVAAPARGSSSGESPPVLPILALTTLGALLILGLGLVPSTAVPRSRMSAVLEEHHGHFTLLGGVALLAVAIFFTLTLLTK
jgi:hypothetical protein